MGLNIGIVGLPNIGKSTLYNAIAAVPAQAENYPFCTIEPNTAIVSVPEERLQQIAALFNPEKIIPNILEIVDIAGLVKGASKGEGLGNQFLGHIRSVNAIAHVVRCFDDDNIIHVENKVDPLHDISLIETELILADLEQVEKYIDRLTKQAKGNKASKEAIPLWNKVKEGLTQGEAVRSLDLTEEERLEIDVLNLLTGKPFFYVMNVTEENLAKPNQYMQAVQEQAAKQNVRALPICAKLEAELSQMEIEEREEFLQDLGIKDTGLDLIVQEGFRLLEQISFFTAGPKEVRAWNVLGGSKAPQAAGKIHSDIERGFIRAEVYHINDLLTHKSEAKIKELGKLRIEGKDYIMQDGDIVHFRFNV